MPDSSIPPKLRLRTSILVVFSALMVTAMMGWGTMRLSRPSTLPTAIVYNQVSDIFTVETRPTPWWSVAFASEDMPFYTIVPDESGTSTRVEGLYIDERFMTGKMGTELRSEAYIRFHDVENDYSTVTNTRFMIIYYDSMYNLAPDRDDPDALLLASGPPLWGKPRILHCTNGTWTVHRNPVTLHTLQQSQWQ